MYQVIRQQYFHLKIITFLTVTFCIFSCKKTMIELPYKVTQTVTEDSAMVVTVHPLSSKVGVNTLKQGGNAVDAAIATQFALAVVCPRAGNLGGGGFMVIRMANGETASIDYREKAPAAATRDMYLDENDEVIPKLSTHGAMAVGVPGTVAGMEALHEKYGTLEWKELIQPAIDLARDGFPILEKDAERFNEKKAEFVEYNRHPTQFVKFWKWRQGDMLTQPDLAKSLERIRDKGKAGFYEGETADLLVDEIKYGGGIISKADLKNYAPVWRKPLEKDFKGHTVISMPPASSGGIALLQMLEMSERLPLKEWGFHQPKTVHAMVEIMRRAFADRAEFLGDADHYHVPIEQLLDSAYLVEKIADFDETKTLGSDSVAAGDFPLIETLETTHSSFIDEDGNAVSCTTTINSSFGSKVVVKGAGFFLNNEMDDFSSKPGIPNLYGLVGAEANSIQPEKRMLSSMTPTIVLKNNKPYLVVGAPGGSAIISAVYQSIMNVIEFDMSMEDAVAAPRFHHQWLPDEIWMEEGKFPKSLVKSLEEMGHKITTKKTLAQLKNILVEPDGKLTGVGDPRYFEDDAEGY